MTIIRDYCGSEAGVRSLKKCLDRIYRKVTAKIELGVVNSNKSL